MLKLRACHQGMNLSGPRYLAPNFGARSGTGSAKAEARDESKRRHDRRWCVPQ